MSDIISSTFQEWFIKNGYDKELLHDNSRELAMAAFKAGHEECDKAWKAGLEVTFN